MSAPPLARGATRAPSVPRDEVAELLGEVEHWRAEVNEQRSELLDLVRRVGKLERDSQVAAGDRSDRAATLADVDARLRRIEITPG